MDRDDENYKPHLIIPGNPDERRIFPEPIEHHGVKGMHWGVWNEETAARYNGVSNRKYNRFKDIKRNHTYNHNKKENTYDVYVNPTGIPFIGRKKFKADREEYGEQFKKELESCKMKPETFSKAISKANPELNASLAYSRNRRCP